MDESVSKGSGADPAPDADDPGVVRALGRSPVTQVLIGVNVVVYLVEVAAPDPIINQYGQFGLAVAAGEYHRLLSSAFVHLPNPAHIVGNMIALAVLGPAVESHLGRGRLVLVYLLCVLGGSTLSYLLMDPQARPIGASGATFGLCGLIAVTWPRVNRAWTAPVIVLLVLGLPASFARPLAELDWAAHLGGLATGAVLGAVFGYIPRARRGFRAAAVCAVVASLAGGIAYQSTVLAEQLHRPTGTYYVAGPQTSCTGYPRDYCSASSFYHNTWTISGCTDQRCWITAPGWAETVALTRNTAGHWIATATRTTEFAGTCRGHPAPTYDHIDVTVDHRQQVPGLRGTVRTAVPDTTVACTPGARSWNVVGSR